MSLLVDVRCEQEFSNGHIPGAFHIPLLNNDEHKKVGTLFKKQGFDVAFHQALDFVGPKMSSFVSAISSLASKSQPIFLYCARGGMRSQTLCWLFKQAGFQVDILEGGYKKFRTEVIAAFKRPFNLKVVCGLTGTGKTEYLKSLHAKGEQVLNLEEIAKHRGSAFGSTQQPQPTQQQFENNLYAKLSSFDIQKLIWIEDESSLIGQCQIPKPLYEQIKKAPSMLLEIPLEDRIRNILQEYAPRNREEMDLRIEQILQISKRLGLERSKCAISAIRNGQFDLAISIILPYYDKTYLHSLTKRRPLIKY